MKKLLLVANLIWGFVALAVTPTVSGVTAKQRYPWNGLVDIDCIVSGIEESTNGLYFVVATANSDSGVIHNVSHFWVVQNWTNSVDCEVRENGEYRIVWDARADLGSVMYSNLVVRVSLSSFSEFDSHGKVQLWEGGPYWAETNIGAEKPWEYGCLFWWGDTIGYKMQDGWTASDGSSSNFSFASGYTTTYDKDPATLRSEGVLSTDNSLAPEYDAAQVQWGVGWRMPKYQELYDLRYKCDWTLTNLNGAKGYLVRGRGAYACSSIFLPADGYGLGTSLYWGNEDGYYWSSEPVNTTYAWCLYFANSGVAKLGSDKRRYLGCSIRPVQEPDSTGVQAGDSLPFRLDTTMSPVVDSLLVSFNAAWVGGDTDATVVVTDNGMEVKRATGAGDFDLPLSVDGRHELTCTTYIDGVAQEEVYSATIYAKWKYVINGEGVGIAETTLRSGDVEIPSEIDGYPVTGVAASVFSGCSGLTGVTIPDSVTSVGNLAFCGCLSLTNLTMGGSVRTIGDSAFRDCSSLTSITLPKSVISVGSAIFGGCAGLESLTLPFVGSERGNTGIANSLFGWIFGEIAYSGGVATQQYYTKSNSKTYYIPASLKTVVLTDETVIGYRAFWDCSNLVSVSIPRTVKSMGTQAFKHSSLTSVYIQSLEEWCNIQFGSYAANPLDSAHKLYLNDSLVAELIIPEGVTRIGDWAFISVDVAKLTVASSVTEIGKEAFVDNNMLESVIFEGNAPVMGDNVFGGAAMVCCAYVHRGSTGWGVPIPGTWNGIAIDYFPQYAVALDANGGTCKTNAVDVEIGSAIGMLPSPSRDNAVFIGWFTAADGGEKVGEDFVPDNAMTLYAHWLESPIFAPVSGTIFNESLTVLISCPTDDAKIYYTTNRSEPTVESQLHQYISINGKTTIKAIAEKDGVLSEVITAEYANGRCVDPIILPMDGTVFERPNQVVSIQWNEEDGVLRYTLDGSEPTSDSPVYVGSFTINGSTVVKAKVFSDNYFDSAVVTATLTQIGVAMPVIDANASFAGSKTKVAILCATDGAIVRYTLNGNDPNSHSTKYTGPFYVTDSCTVKAYAMKSGYSASAVATQTIEKIWGIGDTLGKPDHAFTTTGDGGAGWAKVDDATAPNGEAMKSGAITHNQSSVLATTVVGPGTLTFSWRTSCEDSGGAYDWDHVEFTVDGDVLLKRDGINNWAAESVVIAGEGEHTVTWTYMKDDVEEDGDDAAYVAGYGWASDLTETQTTQVHVPYAWLLGHDPEIVDEYDAYEAAAKVTGANGHKVWESYVIGADPNDKDDMFRITAFPMKADGTPDLEAITIAPAQSKWNVNGAQPVLKGKATLEGAGEWQTVTEENKADMRFFKVEVLVP